MDMDKTAEVVSLRLEKAKRENDNTHMTPLDIIEETKREILSGERVCDKMLILTLDTSNDGYHVGFYAADLRITDMLALMEVMKATLIHDMGLT